MTEQQKNSELPIAPKCNQVEKATRVREVVKMLLDLKTNTEIVEYISEKYHISRATVNNYINDANHEIRKTIPDSKSIVGQHVALYKKIARNNQGQDDKVTLQALAQMEKLLKLHNPSVQINNNTLNLNLEGVDNEEITEIIKSLGGNKHEPGITETNTENTEGQEDSSYTDL